jgi:hypothetical protein
MRRRGRRLACSETAPSSFPRRRESKAVRRCSALGPRLRGDDEGLGGDRHRLLDLGVRRIALKAGRVIAPPVRRLQSAAGRAFGCCSCCEWPDRTAPDPAQPDGPDPDIRRRLADRRKSRGAVSVARRARGQWSCAGAVVCLAKVWGKCPAFNPQPAPVALAFPVGPGQRSEGKAGQARFRSAGAINLFGFLPREIGRTKPSSPLRPDPAWRIVICNAGRA